MTDLIFIICLFLVLLSLNVYKHKLKLMFIGSVSKKRKLGKKRFADLPTLLLLDMLAETHVHFRPQLEWIKLHVRERQFDFYGRGMGQEYNNPVFLFAYITQ